MSRPGSVLDTHRSLSAELGTALDGRGGWQRIDGTTFVGAGRSVGAEHVTVIGRDTGWVVVRYVDGERSEVGASSALDAVTLLDDLAQPRPERIP